MRIKSALDLPPSLRDQVDAMMGTKKRGQKYGNTATVVDGIRFDSKAEAERYTHLTNAYHAGALYWFVRQVPFDLPGKIKYVADFVCYWRLPSVRCTVEDVKGMITPVAMLKLKQMLAVRRIDVDIVRRETGGGFEVRPWSTF